MGLNASYVDGTEELTKRRRCAQSKYHLAHPHPLSGCARLQPSVAQQIGACSEMLQPTTKTPRVSNHQRAHIEHDVPISS